MQGTVLLRACPWMMEARRLIGAKEIRGPAHSSAVVRMWESIKAPFRDDETPWCAAFVGHCLEAVGVKSTRSAAARSYSHYGQELTMADLARGYYGAIAVLSRPGSSWSGHVGFLTGYDPAADVLQLLGGNQDNQVRFSEYKGERLLDLRWPTTNIPWSVPGGVPCPPFTAKLGLRPGSDA